MNKHKHCFPLSIQIVLPDNYKENYVFQNDLKCLQNFGFYGVELNMSNPVKFNISEIQKFLEDFNLQMTKFASGLTAKTFNLSLSTDNEVIRKKSIEKFKEIMDFVAGHDIGIIVGFFKGSGLPNVSCAKKLFSQSLEELSYYSAEKKVEILIEATNKKETLIANTLEEAVDFIKDFNNPFLKILPDTYHICFEEEFKDWKILKKYKNYFNSLHISDDNRYFPGLGSIEFDKIFKLLKEMNYQGGIAIEGNIKDNFANDVKASLDYLSPLIITS